MRILRTSATGIVPIVNTDKVYCVQIEDNFYPICRMENGKFFAMQCVFKNNKIRFERAHNIGEISLQRSVEDHMSVVNNSDSFMLEFENMDEFLEYMRSKG